MIECSDKYIDNLIDHFIIRQKILEHIEDSNENENENAINTKLDSDERDGMIYLFDYLIELRKKEGINSKTDVCSKYIKNAKKAAIEATDSDDDTCGNYDEVVEQLRKAIKKCRKFNIGLFLKHYKEHEIACELSLKNENVALFIGSTGAGKSTTIYFLNGVEMEKDNKFEKHIRAKKGATIKKELLNVKLAQSHRTSVTSHITPVPFIAENENLIESKIMFCDTPGFGDSRGDEIDISNSFGLINGMNSSKSVRIIFVISQDDTSLRMKQLKIMSDHLYQYLSNYKNNNNSNDSNKNLEKKINGDNSDDNDSDDYDDSDDNGVEIISVNANFFDKLSDICIVFTKFSSIESIKNLFSKNEMRKLEKEHKKNKNAFYYLNKHIHDKLVKNNNIILIDPINGNYKNVLSDIFSGNKNNNNNNGKWIEAGNDNFQAYISPERMLTIRDQVNRDYKYIKRVLNSNNSQKIYNSCNFDYFALIENKINELNQFNNIIVNQSGDVVKYPLNCCINMIINHWNNICQNFIDKAIGCENNHSNIASRQRLNHVTAQDYDLSIENLLGILQKLVTRYNGFVAKHLPTMITKDQMKNAVCQQLTVAKVDCQLNSKEQQPQPQENKTDLDDVDNTQLELKEHDVNGNNPDNSDDTNKKSTDSSVDDRVDCLLRCLVIIKHFVDLGDLLCDFYQEMDDKCCKCIKENEFENVISVLEVLDGTLRKSVDLEIKSIQETPQWQRLTLVSKNIKQNLSKHFEDKLKGVETLLDNVEKENEEILKSTLNRLKTETEIVCNGTAELMDYFVNDNVINLRMMMQSIEEMVKKCHESIEAKIDSIFCVLAVDHQNSTNNHNTQTVDDNEKKESDLVVIYHLVDVLDCIIKAGEMVLSHTDRNTIMDGIIHKVVNNLNIASNNLEMIVNEMKWMVKYHSSKQSLGRLFEHTIIQSKTNDLNRWIDSIDSIDSINSKGRNLTPQMVEKIVNEITAIATCCWEAQKIFCSRCDFGSVTSQVSPTINILQEKIETLLLHCLDLKYDQFESKTEQKDKDLSEITLNNERAYRCVELLEGCKKLQGIKDVDSSDSNTNNTSTIEIELVNKQTQTQIAEYLENYGTFQRNSIANGLTYFKRFVENIVSKNTIYDANIDLSNAKDFANSITKFSKVESIIAGKYKLLSEYLYVDKDVNSVILQWKKDISVVYNKLAQIISNRNNSSIIISSTMIICRSLTVVDECGIMENVNHGGGSFVELAHKIESLVDDECKELMICIDHRDFAAVLQQFKKQQIQLLVAAKYDTAREYLANAMLTITTDIIKLIEILPMITLDKYLEIRKTLKQLTEQIRQILVLDLSKYIDDANKDKWKRNLIQMFGHARSSSSTLLGLSLLNFEVVQYDKLQTQIEILNDFEWTLMALKQHQDVYNYETSDNEMKEVVNKVQQRLSQDCTEMAGWNVKTYHLKLEPSTICTMLSNALNICNTFSSNNKEHRVENGLSSLPQHYQRAIEKIEESFRVVFKRDCKSIVKIRSQLYQYCSLVDIYRNLAASLVGGNLKSSVEATLAETVAQFDRLRQEEDDKIIHNFTTQSTSLMDKVWGAKDAFWGVSTHRSLLGDLKAVYEEYLKRVEYQDDNMITKLKIVILNRMRNECKDIEHCLSDNKLFNANSTSIINLQNRINEFEKVIGSIIKENGCDDELKSHISVIIIQSYQTIQRYIKTWQCALPVQFNKVEIIQRWFAAKSSQDVTKYYVAKLATHILRLLKGLVHYCDALVKLFPQTLERVNVKRIVVDICNSFNSYCGKWIHELKKHVTDNNFSECAMYLKTIRIFEQDEGMKQIRSSIDCNSLKTFRCEFLSGMIIKHLRATQNDIIDETDGLGVIYGGDVTCSMQMRRCGTSD